MTKEEMQNVLKGLGLKKSYRPYQEDESETILIKTRKATSIVKDGELKGTEIGLIGSDFHVWTPQKSKAKKCALANNLKVRLMDGEAVLIVPAFLADKLLPVFGAKTRKELTPEQIEALKVRMETARNARKLAKNPTETATLQS